eukprot:XP_003726668.1 PREDICTED: intestinal mucin-like protein [Strongylocentrotus purpuratus]
MSTTPPPSDCSPRLMKTPAEISYRSCVPVEPFYMMECAGTCDSSLSVKIVDGVVSIDYEYCSCCRPSNFLEKTTELICPDGSNLLISVPVITDCSCHQTQCASSTNAAYGSVNAMTTQSLTSPRLAMRSTPFE